VTRKNKYKSTGRGTNIGMGNSSSTGTRTGTSNHHLVTTDKNGNTRHRTGTNVFESKKSGSVLVDKLY
jgi:hypothetical protein